MSDGPSIHLDQITVIRTIHQSYDDVFRDNQLDHGLESLHQFFTINALGIL